MIPTALVICERCQRQPAAAQVTGWTGTLWFLCADCADAWIRLPVAKRTISRVRQTKSVASVIEPWWEDE